ncbi:phosphatase PAP2 family protein [Demequina pelophila]|uniref:phosphatase PAP2 family protein n=1 Tax=Demequina pelophila TaxID=1638984 RepID=UPI000780F3A7|nr:phosphatase PAP2 family protein [Demequina pelophila]
MKVRLRPADALVALWPALALVALGGWGFFALLGRVRDGEGLALLDQPLVEWIAEGTPESAATALDAVTVVLGWVILPALVVVIAGVWWWATRSWWHPALLLGAMGLALGLEALVTWAVAAPGPGDGLAEVPGYEVAGSFPSWHSIGAATLVLVAGYLLWHDNEEGGWRLGAWAALALGLLVAVAGGHIYQGEPFLADVLGGTCVALVVLGAVVAVERWRDLALELVDPPVRPSALGDEPADVLPWAAQQARLDRADAEADADAAADAEAAADSEAQAGSDVDPAR